VLTARERGSELGRNRRINTSRARTNRSASVPSQAKFSLALTPAPIAC